MKIYLVSDLHVELNEIFPLPSAAVDVVVLAGDIHKGSKVFDVAAEFHRHCHAPVIIVVGNHEYYGKDYIAQLAEFRRNAAMLRNVFVLENDQAIIDGVRFLGCTLWSSFALYGEDQIATAQREALRCIADFSVIRYGDRRFTPDDAKALHHESHTWLESQLAQPFDGKTVVVTHFLPHGAGIHPMHATQGGDYLTPYFTTDCSPLMKKYRIDAWLCGHTHNSVDVIVENGTRLVSNQRGYSHERLSYTRFDTEKIIDLDANDGYLRA